MDCPNCGTGMVAFAVSADLRDCLPGEEPGAALCPRCLELEPVGDPPADPPDFTRIGDAFPEEPEAAVPMALLVGLVSSLALYRSEVETLLAHVERAGVDSLLVLDRLAVQGSIETDTDLRGRRTQLEQLL